jgi:hypothetical protein
MIHVALPDPLVWQAGIEFGLEAIAEVAATHDVVCRLRDRGPMLEAVGFAVYQLGLSGITEFRRSPLASRRVDVVLVPRVTSLGPVRMPGSAILITTDPALAPPGSEPLPRRDPQTIANALRHAARDKR